MKDFFRNYECDGKFVINSEEVKNERIRLSDGFKHAVLNKGLIDPDTGEPYASNLNKSYAIYCRLLGKCPYYDLDRDVFHRWGCQFGLMWTIAANTFSNPYFEMDLKSFITMLNIGNPSMKVLLSENEELQDYKRKNSLSSSSKENNVFKNFEMVHE